MTGHQAHTDADCPRCGLRRASLTEFNRLLAASSLGAAHVQAAIADQLECHARRLTGMAEEQADWGEPAADNQAS